MQCKIIGAGLAGCEAALWLADAGVQVDLYEQKPGKFSPAHKSSTREPIRYASSWPSRPQTVRVYSCPCFFRILYSLSSPGSSIAPQMPHPCWSGYSSRRFV